LIGRTPPVERRRALYFFPTVAAFNGAFVASRRSTMTKRRFAVLFKPSASVTVSATVDVPAAVGLPLMAPVAASNVRPDGSTPLSVNV
jgi:hypothetical protein